VLTTDAGRIYQGLSDLITLRKAAPELAGGRIIDFATDNKSVVDFIRSSDFNSILVLANFDDTEQLLPPALFVALPARALDLVGKQRVRLRTGLRLPAHGFCWLRYGDP